MSKIHVMNDVLANKIAAGEVVESVMNVVKELVENSIDAEADEIIISLEEAGTKRIEVKDNGIGMDKEDAILAFKRHATSKIENVDDLFYIESLGFRGEALPSIASVSKISLKTNNGTIGTSISINGGKDLKVRKCSCPKGTNIIVEDLFYNTPVRLKYLNNLYTELARVVEYVDKMALSYPNIKFKLSNNSNNILETNGNGDLLRVIHSIYGSSVSKKMIEINNSNDDYEISGYISYPEITRSTKNHITILVNGRVIKNNKINKCIIDAYHTYIHKGRYPIIVLNIIVDPILVDVNVHPTKMDIKFSKMDSLLELINNSISKLLKKINLIPHANVRNSISINDVYNQIVDIKDSEEETNLEYEEIKLDFDIKEDSEDYSINKMKVIGNIFMTYILCIDEDKFYLVDQHGGAERIKYEKLMDISKDNKEVIDLLTPIKLDFTHDEFIKINNNIDYIKELGFNVEVFGSNSFIIRSHPLWISEDRSVLDIKDVFEYFINNNKFNKNKFLEDIIISISCHSSVKAHEYLSIEDMQWIVDNLIKCKNPYTCPHGRPTIISYERSELDKMFKRDYNE